MALALVYVFTLNRTDNEKFQRTSVCYFRRAFAVHSGAGKGAATTTNY